jgi:ATP-dependent DNA helicase RecQ
MSIEKIKQQLQYLNKLQILAYRPQKEKPQLQFIKERAGQNDFHIDAERYAFLKNRAKFRMESQLKYVEAQHCRMNTLVEYFGETRLNPCGICDNCLSKKDNSSEINAQIEQLDKVIRAQLTEKPLSISVLSAPFHGVVREALLQKLHVWLDQGIIIEREGLLFLIK